MTDVSTETQPAKTFNAEAFAMNIARAMESSGQALAAYLKPRETGELKDKPPSEVGEVIKTLSVVAEYWLSDKERAADLQTKMGKAYLDLFGSAMRRMAGEQDAKPAIEPSPRDKRFKDPEWKSNQFFDFVMQLYLLDHAMGAGTGQERRRPRSAHPQEGRVLRSADHQRDRAVEFRPHQSGSAARDAGVERRQPRSRHEDAGGRHRGRPRQLAHPPVRSVQPRGRRQHGDDAGQGDLPERADAADPVHADHGTRAAHAAPDRAAVDQQILHPRSEAGKILHQMVRRSGHHGVRDLLGQSGQGTRQEDLRRLHEGRPAHGDGRDRKGDRRNEGSYRRLLRRRHPARLDAGVACRKAPRAGDVGDVLCRPGRFHPCRRSAGVRRRGPDFGARTRHAGRPACSKAARWRWPSTCCARTI